MKSNTRKIGIAGLGTMGADLALNIADHGYSVAAYDNNEIALRGLRSTIDGSRIEVTSNLVEFVSLLATPRTVIILAPAGPPVDRLINRLMHQLASGDLIVDGANSYFKDTEARSSMPGKRGIQFLGLGISGGERGIRHGAMIMAGGSVRAYDCARRLFHDIGLTVGGEACVAYLGPRSAGHYVSMVLNGVEQAVTQLVAETYDLMSRGLGLTDTAIQHVYANWCVSEAGSNLLEVSLRTLNDRNSDAGPALFEMVAANTPRNAGARWASLEARNLDVPAPTIEVAVAIQMLSGLEESNPVVRKPHDRRPIRYVGRPDFLIDQLKRALYAGMAITFAQGLALLRVASDEYQYDLAFQSVAHVWRGSLLHSQMLEEIYEALCAEPHLPFLLSDSHFADRVRSRHRDLRGVVRLANESAIPARAFAASLAYHDSFLKMSGQDTAVVESRLLDETRVVRI